jgi:hypothetical protein
MLYMWRFVVSRVNLVFDFGVVVVVCDDGYKITSVRVEEENHQKFAVLSRFTIKTKK